MLLLKVKVQIIEGGRVSAPQMVINPLSGCLYTIYYRADSKGAAISFFESGGKGETRSDEKEITHFVKVPEHKHRLSGETVVLAEDILKASLTPRAE